MKKTSEKKKSSKLSEQKKELQKKRLLREQISLLEKKKAIIQGLPHKYGCKLYAWQREFIDSTNRINLLTAANQIGKSTAMIKKCIEWATNRELWPSLWTTKPIQFWYLYPTKDVATLEFKLKWEPELMPRNQYKTHPVYGWKSIERNRIIHSVIFNSGVTVVFKSYEQDQHNLQSGSVWALFADEEIPEEIFDELMIRLSAGNINGYFHQVFTATRGQEFWRRAIEGRGDNEELRGAYKRQISMYDCMEYEDGSQGPYTQSKIEFIKQSCKSETEVKRRVYGKFVVDGGLRYAGFARDINVIEPLWESPPKDWLVYSGVDVGSGGEKGHPAAISFIAVRPDYKFGVVFAGWKGARGETTTASDILLKYRQLRGDMKPVIQTYDFASKDFYVYASRLGETFSQAEKGKDLGADTLNTLFKNRMLMIFDIPALHPLVNELVTLTHSKRKEHARDDFIDSIRYAITDKIPWDWSAAADLYKEKVEPKKKLTELERRREWFVEGGEEMQYDKEDEIEEWNDYLNG